MVAVDGAYLTPWLDGVVPLSQTPTRLLASGRADVEVLFVERVDDTTGRVLYPVDSDNLVVAPLAPGRYAVGAVCPAVLGADGRIASVYPPIDLGEGERLSVGEWTEDVVDMGVAVEGAVSDLKDLADQVVEQSGVLEAHATHLADLDERIEDIPGVILSFENQIGDANQRVTDVVAGLGSALDLAGQAKLAADAAYADRTPNVKIESSRGTAFKNNLISTDLRVTVFLGDKTITTLDALWAEFGSTAYLEWWWRREDDDEFGLVSASDDRLSRGGFCLTVSPDDVDEQTTFRCTLNA